MSTWLETVGTCPECNATTPARIATSVHITRVPHVRMEVLERTINRFTCARCARRIEIDHGFTYVDVERGHWVHVEPVSRRADWAAVERATMQALACGLDLTSPIVSELAVTARRRVVFGSEELREKLIVWDAGIDDGLLECIKLRTLIDQPSAIGTRLIADRVADDGGLEIVRLEDGQPPRTYAVPSSWIDRALDEQGSLRARYPELFRGGFVNALRVLAVALMVAVGCSQPPPRDQSPPRPKDAMAVADAPAPADAATDAEPPPDAYMRRVAWEAIRGYEPSRQAIHVAARVVGVHVDNAGIRLVLDRGKEHGVHKGWKGRFLDDENHPILEPFEIVEVYEQTSHGRTTGNPDRTRRISRAVLWNPGAGEP